MAAQDLLRNKVDETPTIYAYTLPDVPKYKGLLKVGYTSRPGTIQFIEDQIYNRTYSDEQAAKEKWKGENNPYAQLPKMVMLTYQMPESISEIASQGEFDEFDLNEFFRAEDDSFIHEEYVQKWLDMIRGSYTDLLAIMANEDAHEESECNEFQIWC